MRLVAWYAVLFVLFWGPVMLLTWRTPSWFAVALVLLGAVFALASDLLASSATKQAEVGLLAPIEYAQIPASAVIGWALFAEQPGWNLATGAAIMLAATLYLMRRG